MVATATALKRRFVPQSLDLTDFANLQPLYQGLLDRRVETQAELEQWLTDFSELWAVVDEFSSRRYIDKSCHTDDAKIQAAFLHYVQNVEPRIKPYFFRLQKKLLESPALSLLDPKRFGVLIRRWKEDVAVFRDESVPLETKIVEEVNEYDKLCGAMMIEFRGQTYTPQQMVRFFEEPDRPTRQAAWEAHTNRYLADRDAFDDIFERLLPLRQQIARNAGLANYRDYAWKINKRFDYTPDDCRRFSDAIAQTCMPLMNRLFARKAADLGLEKLRPWDLEADPKNRPPLRPFTQKAPAVLVDKTREIFQRLSPALASDFDQLSAHRNLDLDSRKGKQPGGYQCALEESGQPFIFMNAVGTQRDVEVLLHEGGHAFHYLAAAGREPLVFLRHAPTEFAEVASMSMELLGGDHLEVFYADGDARRARDHHLEKILRFLPWMTTIDSFQHWIYTNPGHTRAERTAHWLTLMDRFGGQVDFSGHEAPREARWQQQLHLFHHPFYYIEYGIAQLGALQLWMKSRHDMRQALANYRAALALGGTRSLPELFSAAGINFDFSEKTLRPLMETLAEELEL
ncbi:MAG TPA: M3 family oligoendopeptidase [Humisphaera sp.]|jgi:oligoendopeptidase F|nr:M3 family oligoendopeptidase [Humisphaera sp.]